MREHLQNNKKQYALLGLLIALIVLMSALSPDKFLTARNFRSMGFQMAEFGILAIGMSVVIMTGGINLSLVNSAMLSSIVGAMLMRSMTAAGMGDIPIIACGILMTIIVSVVCGMFNGVFAAYIGVSSMLVTLGSQTVFNGVALNITQGAAVSGFPKLFQRIGAGSMFGVPYTIMVYLLVVLVAFFLVERSSWGVSVYMIGGNEKATRFSGINTKRVLMKVYIFSAVMAGIAGILMTSRYNSAKSDYGMSYTMQAVAASVLGGTDITGGAGSILGVVNAVAVLQVISSGLNILGVNKNIVDVVTGLILVGVLTFNFIASKDRVAKAKAA